MRLRMFHGALALGAALICALATPASAQDAALTVAAASEASAGNLYVYPGSFPCVHGPGFCRKIVIIIILNAQAVCNPDHDYRNTGTVELGVSEKAGVGFLADVKGSDIPKDLILRKGQVAIATRSCDPPPDDLK